MRVRRSVMREPSPAAATFWRANSSDNSGVDADHPRAGERPAERHRKGTHARLDVEDASVAPTDSGPRDQLSHDHGTGAPTLQDPRIGVVPASGADRIVDEVNGLPEHRGRIADHGRAFPLVEVGAQVRRADEI
jgi:hypothetical protein